MISIIVGHENGKFFEKEYEEYSISKEELFRKYMAMQPKKEQAIFLFCGDGYLKKGIRVQNVPKPIL